MKISIYLKVTVFSMVLVFFTAIAFYLITKKNTENSLEMQIKRKLKNQSDYIINSIDYFVFERHSDIRHIAKDAIFQQPGIHQHPRKITNHLLSIKKENPLYESFSFFDAQRVRIADTKGLKIGQQHSYTKYWTQLTRQESALDVSLSESLGKAVMHFAQTIRNKNGKKIGIVVSRVLIKRLYEVFSPAIPLHELNKGVKIDLIDTQGRLLYSSSHPKNILVKKHPNLALLRQHLWNKSQQRKKQSTFEKDGRIFFYSREPGYLNYKGSGWILVMSIPKKVAYAPTTKLRNVLLLSFIPIILVAIVIALLFAHYFSRPIVLLAKLAQEYGKGNFWANISFKSNDERKFLHRSLTWMAGQLRFKMQEQDDLNRKLNLKIHEIEEQNKEIEEQRSQITESISYAERLQNVLLPTKGEIKELLSQHFIIFKPRDMVSGDFYWVSRVKLSDEGEKMVIAAIDCTGHGVPGAFMSVIAYNMLHQIVDVEKNTNPVVILHHLNKRVKTLLHQGESSKVNENERVSDGMDLSLCVVDMAQRQLEFCGANRPLYVVRNKQLVEFKGNKWSIGGGADYFNKRTQRMHDNDHLETVNIDLQVNDRVYLFSDGITDQFGERSQAKFSSKRLKNAIAQTCTLPMNLQCSLIAQRLEDWQGSEFQIDDILLMGFWFTAEDFQKYHTSSKLAYAPNSF
ncbi:SpoIIE family protein phosphatase [Microscilla marina]|nr:SpoIIE family protein phosphatase [Microscilla marina]